MIPFFGKLILRKYLCDLTRKCYLLYLKVVMPFYITCCYLLGAVWHYLRGQGITSSIEHLRRWYPWVFQHVFLYLKLKGWLINQSINQSITSIFSIARSTFSRWVPFVGFGLLLL